MLVLAHNGVDVVDEFELLYVLEVNFYELDDFILDEEIFGDFGRFLFLEAELQQFFRVGIHFDIVREQADVTKH